MSAEILTDETGKQSASRSLMLSYMSLLVTCWLGVGVAIAFFNADWASYAGWLDWAKDLGIGVLGAYVLGKGAGALRRPQEPRSQT